MTSNKVLINIVRFILLVFFQVFILNKLNIAGYLHPYAYILFIILLPFETPAWLRLILGFSLGLTVDLFSGTVGMHAAATTLMAYVRPFALKTISSRKDYEQGMSPGIKDLGLQWFISYSLLLTFIHHSLYFFVEAFILSEIFQIILRIAASTIVSTLIIVLLNLLFVSRSKRK